MHGHSLPDADAQTGFPGRLMPSNSSGMNLHFVCLIHFKVAVREHSFHLIDTPPLYLFLSTLTVCSDFSQSAEWITSCVLD
jgi:hypothetical protein